MVRFWYLRMEAKANPFAPARGGSVPAPHCAHCSARGSPDTNTFPDDTDGSRPFDTNHFPSATSHNDPAAPSAAATCLITTTRGWGLNFDDVFPNPRNTLGRLARICRPKRVDYA